MILHIVTWALNSVREKVLWWAVALVLAFVFFSQPDFEFEKPSGHTKPGAADTVGD